MRKFIIAFIWLLYLSCSDNRKEESKTILIEKRKKGILNDWVITDNFYSDTIVLNLLDSSTNRTIDILTLNKNGSIKYWEYNPQPRCGNGIYYLDSTSFWKCDSNSGKIIFNLYGGVNMEHEFKRKIEYHLKCID